MHISIRYDAWVAGGGKSSSGETYAPEFPRKGSRYGRLNTWMRRAQNQLNEWTTMANVKFEGNMPTMGEQSLLSQHGGRLKMWWTRTLKDDEEKQYRAP